MSVYRPKGLSDIEVRTPPTDSKGRPVRPDYLRKKEGELEGTGAIRKTLRTSDQPQSPIQQETLIPGIGKKRFREACEALLASERFSEKKESEATQRPPSRIIYSPNIPAPPPLPPTQDVEVTTQRGAVVAETVRDKKTLKVPIMAEDNPFALYREPAGPSRALLDAMGRVPAHPVPAPKTARDEFLVRRPAAPGGAALRQIATGPVLNTQMFRDLLSVAPGVTGLVFSSSALGTAEEVAGAAAEPEKPIVLVKHSLFYMAMASVYYTQSTSLRPEITPDVLMALDLVFDRLPEGMRMERNLASERVREFGQSLVEYFYPTQQEEAAAADPRTGSAVVMPGYGDILTEIFTEDAMKNLKKACTEKEATTASAFFGKASKLLTSESYKTSYKSKVMSILTSVIVGIARKGVSSQSYNDRVTSQLKVSTGLEVILNPLTLKYFAEISAKAIKNDSGYIQSLFTTWEKVAQEFDQTLRITLIARQTIGSFMTALTCYLTARASYSTFPWGAVERLAGSEED